MPTARARQTQWPDQPAFTSGFARLAANVFEALGADLAPSVRLLGVSRSSRRAQRAWIDPPGELTHFAPVLARIDELSEMRADAANVLGANLRNRVERVRVEHGGTLSFCGRPMAVRRNFVVPVLELDAERYYALPALAQRDREIGGRRLDLPCSLAEAVIERVLDETVRELTRDRPGYYLDWASRNEAELRRDAGDAFAWRADVAGLQPDTGELPARVGMLYADCNEISAMAYEGREGEGSMLVARQGHPHVVVALRFPRPVPLEDRVWSRKVLQMASERVLALSDGRQIYGLGTLADEYDPRDEDAFVIRFAGRDRWDLRHAGQALMRVSYGLPALPVPRLSRESIARRLRAALPRISDAHVATIWEVLQVARRQKHGTLLVISTAAAREAERLAEQAMRVEPRTLDADLVRRVTEIDGAVLLDPQGRCHAVGVILDGRIRPGEGTPGRGARFNSAVRYVRSSRRAGRARAVAIVLSEDGMVDVVA